MTVSSSSSHSARRQHWLGQIDAVLRARGIEAAAPLALKALADGVEDSTFLNLAGLARYDEGRFGEAVGLLKRARALAPKDPHVLNSLAMSLAAAGENKAGLEAYGAALRIDPSMAAVHFNRGMLLEKLNDLNAARSAYERAAELDSHYAEPIASLAWLDARAGDASSAEARAERALSLSNSNVLARMALASAALQRKDLNAAAERLSALNADPRPGSVNRSIVLSLIGDLRDAEGRAAEAFTAYEESNATLREAHAAQFAAPGQQSPVEHVRQMTAWFEAFDPELWSDAPPARPRAADPKAHIFLVGFPRSGTTLLENVLAGHPDVVALEEKDCLAIVSEAYVGSPDGLERLARVSAGEALRGRDAYWSMVRAFGVEPRGRVFIDKMPLSSALLPVVAKLFPNARVLFARRDPRDVVLSCFRRRFGMNPSMYQLLSLDGAAAYYDAVMRLSELYQNLLPLPQHIIRYESLVDGLKGTAKAACEFLSLEWDEAMLDFATKARTRGIATPSSAQVTKGLNREGIGVWRRYRDQMAPVLPVLEPWVERFGYEAN